VIQLARTRFSGPIRSSNGFEVGTGATNTAVIDESGNIVKAGAVATSALFGTGVVTSAALGASAVTSTVLASEAAESKTLTGYSTAAIAAGKPVCITGYYTSLSGYKVSLAYAASTIRRAAEFIVTVASTAAKKPVTMARIASVTRTGTAGALVYLSATAAGALVETAPSGAGMLKQPVGVQTSTVLMKSILAYSKAVTVTT
jgi:hypothetical protein